MLEFLFIFNNLFLYASLAVSLTLLFSFLKLPTLFLYGLFSYIHPDHVAPNGTQSGLRAAIRRPGSDSTAETLQKRHRSKDSKFEFDENKAQIFRLKLDSDHLRSRLYYTDYHSACVLFFVTASCLLLHCLLRRGGGGGGQSEDAETMVNGSLVPVFLGIFAVSRLFLALGRMSFEKSASRRSEKRLSLFFGGLGFMSGIAICSSIPQSIIDFQFDSIGGFTILLIASLMGCLAGFLYIPATKSARSFWLGTDQTRSNLSIISCGWLARMALYLTFTLNVFTALLWIKPLSETLTNTKAVTFNDNNPQKYGSSSELVGNVWFSTSEFAKFRLWCLLLSGVSQIMALRPNIQMFLNEAVLSWYQRLHSSKQPDLDFSRAKVFLHNHYLCLALLQFLAPAAMSLIFLGLSQIDEGSLGRFNSLCYNIPCSVLVKQVALLLSWWEVFVWSVFTLSNLILFRRGFQYVS